MHKTVDGLQLEKIHYWYCVTLIWLNKIEIICYTKRIRLEVQNNNCCIYFALGVFHKHNLSEDDDFFLGSFCAIKLLTSHQVVRSLMYKIIPLCRNASKLLFSDTKYVVQIPLLGQKISTMSYFLQIVTCNVFYYDNFIGNVYLRFVYISGTNKCIFDILLVTGRGRGASPIVS